jgi:hypothetical protein
MNDKLTINIPESIKDITLSQYIEVQKLMERGLDETSFMERVVMLFSGISKRDIKNIDVNDYAMIGQSLAKALNTDSEFQDRFTLNGVEYGFIPNFDNITQGEYIDLTSTDLDNESLPTIMSVLFRPVSKSDSFGNYSIKAYDASRDRIEIMKGAPMNVVNGALVFFWNLANELKNYILKSTEAQEEERSQQ